MDNKVIADNMNKYNQKGKEYKTLEGKFSIVLKKNNMTNKSTISYKNEETNETLYKSELNSKTTFDACETRNKEGYALYINEENNDYVPTFNNNSKSAFMKLKEMINNIINTVSEVTLHSNGKIKFMGEKVSGRPHGKGIEFYDNGNLKYSGSFERGKHFGKGTYYSKDGIFEVTCGNISRDYFHSISTLRYDSEEYTIPVEVSSKYRIDESDDIATLLAKKILPQYKVFKSLCIDDKLELLFENQLKIMKALGIN